MRHNIYHAAFEPFEAYQYKLRNHSETGEINAMTLANIFLLFLLGFAVWYWWRGKAITDFVRQAARQHCKTMDVMLLDDAIYMRGVWFKRDRWGRMRVWRRYLFDFTVTGEERYQGRIIMLGRSIEQIELEPHRIPPGRADH